MITITEISEILKYHKLIELIFGAWTKHITLLGLHPMCACQLICAMKRKNTAIGAAKVNLKW